MLKSLNHILGKVENQPQWHGPQEFQLLLKVWAQVVGSQVADQTRPCSLTRDVLYVATSSSVWVQELQFKRRFLLKKLNGCLSISLTDIRFSTTGWQITTPIGGENVATLWQEHPSRVTPNVVPTSVSVPQNPDAVFQNWAQLMMARSQNLPLCPNCQCPTPPGELERWRVCGLCAVKKWQG